MANPSLTDQFLDFVYVGAPRAGSTWLSAALDAHPQIWAPHNKEIHFFNDRSPYSHDPKYHRGISFYARCFDAAPIDSVKGELSPIYYYDPVVAYRIWKHFPGTRIIAMLRNPVEVIFSTYLKRRELESRAKTFERELLRSPQFMDLGFYHRNLVPYFDRFPREKIFVGIYEYFFKNEGRSLAELYRFLDVDDTFQAPVIGRRLNVAIKPGPSWLVSFKGAVYDLLTSYDPLGLKERLHHLKLNRIDYLKMARRVPDPNRPLMDPDLRQELMEIYEPDISRLEKLLDVDLDIWRNH